MVLHFNDNWEFQRVAHRGFRGHYAENTLLAFEKALEVGATMIELDVRLTKDEVPVVMHDPTLMRLGTHHGHVSDFLWSDLKELELHDAKARHVQSGRVLSLDDLFTKLGTNCNYYVEIKTSRNHPVTQAHRLCDLAVQTVNAHNLSANVLFATFQFHLIQYLSKTHNPAVLGYNFEHRWMGRAVPAELDELNVILCPKASMLTRRRFDKAKTAGFRIIPWTVNRPKRMRELLDWGVDGITSDYPDRLSEVIDALVL